MDWLVILLLLQLVSFGKLTYRAFTRVSPQFLHNLVWISCLGMAGIFIYMLGPSSWPPSSLMNWLFFWAWTNFFVVPTTAIIRLDRMRYS